MPTVFVSDEKKATLPERSPFDYYRTETTLIWEVLMQLPSDGRSILDIGASDGRWGHLAYRYLRSNPIKPFLSGVELRDVPKPAGFDAWYCPADFTNDTVKEAIHLDRPQGYDLILSNPPYKFAEEAVRFGWDLLAGGGTMAFLLPIVFMASQGRYHGLWNELYPHTVYICSRRPSFYGGKTNVDDFAVYVWQKNYYDEPVGHPRQWRTKLLMYDRGDE